MRILANENFPALAVEALRKAGHDVRWIRSDAPGSSDRQVIQLALEQERILVTFDKDFGELVFRERYQVRGIVLFRILAPSANHVAQIAVAALSSRRDWEGQFVVVEDRRVRMRPLHGSAGR